MYLLITCEPGREGDAMLELEWALRNVRVHGTRWRGVLIAETDLPRDEVMRRLRKFEIQALQRVVPFDEMVLLEELEGAAMRLVTARRPTGSFAVRARVRGVRELSAKEIETRLGSKILNNSPHLRVDLSNPDWILAVEVLGNKVGLGLLRSTDFIRLKSEP